MTAKEAVNNKTIIGVIAAIFGGLASLGIGGAVQSQAEMCEDQLCRDRVVHLSERITSHEESDKQKWELIVKRLDTFEQKLDRVLERRR